MELLRTGADRFGLRLSPHQVEQFQQYYELLIEWNRRVNLTRITEFEAVQVKHFLDSLSIALALPPGWWQQPRRVVDVGSGGGLPGVPLKIAFAALQLALVESTSKKADFLASLTERLALAQVEVLPERAEALAHQPRHRETYDLAVSRALAPLSVACELMLPFVIVGGQAVAYRGRRVSDELEAAGRALRTLGGALSDVKAVELPGGSAGRTLVVIEKLSPTPASYPRRPGIPNKRPL